MDNSAPGGIYSWQLTMDNAEGEREREFTQSGQSTQS
jgi:hypothetical protein